MEAILLPKNWNQGKQLSTFLIKDPSCTEHRREIVRLHTEQKKSADKIATMLNGLINPGDRLSQRTMRRHVRAVIVALVNKETRESVEREMHSVVAKRSKGITKAARDDWMEDQGFFVWTDWQVEVFIRLVLTDKFEKEESRQSIAKRRREGNRQRKRRVPLDHVLLSAAMNRCFKTTDFTPDMTSVKIERMRLEATKRRAKEGESLSFLL
jgi:hypothetical protein